MANTTILTANVQILNRGSNLIQQELIPAIKNDITYTKKDINTLTIRSTDNLVTVPFSGIVPPSEMKFIYIEARHTNNNPSALPIPVLEGDLAPFILRINGSLVDELVEGGLYLKLGSVSSLQIATPYSFAPIKAEIVIVG